ncbi:MAG: ABC transporter substrate-binding protein [Acidimicrobiia bacterium]|nr:ABC transporter substrate-binding protein [Acidimicrobiia bacterium]
MTLPTPNRAPHARVSGRRAHRTTVRPVVGIVAGMVALALLAAACGDDTASDGDTASGDPCERNAAVGTITVVTGFDFAASPGILDPIVAEAEGYYDELCLDVEIQPGFAPQNHTLVASGEAQFANAGSFGEVVKANVDGDAGLVALAHYGKTAIEALVVPADSDIETLDDLSGRVVGIKGDLPFSLQTMLGEAGVDRSSFEELLLDTFDPMAGFELGIDALPVYKSNEPIQLDNAGFEYRMFDPLDAGVPSSFGLLVVGEDFLAEHPEVVSDFMRASLRAMRFSIDNPDAAVQHALDRIATNQGSFLGDNTEIPRWQVERDLVVSLTPEGEGYGQIDLDRLGAEVSALTEVGVFETEPDWRSMIAPEIVDDIYDGGTDVTWEPYQEVSDG